MLREAPLSKKLFIVLRYAMLFLALFLLGTLLLRADADYLWQVLRRASVPWVCLSLLCIAINFACAAKRYQILAAPEISYMKIMEVIMAGFLLNYASMVQGIGIGAKVGLMKARQIPVSRSMAGIASEIGVDLLFTGSVGLAYILIADTTSLPAFNPASSLAALIGIAILVILATAAANARWSIVNRVHEELAIIVSSGRLHWVLLSTAGIWCSAGAGYYFLLVAANSAEQVTGLLAFAAICIGFITGLLSMVPGGLGVRELTWSYVVSTGGFSIELAGLLAVIYRLLSIVLIICTLGAGRLFVEKESIDAGN